MKTKWNRFWRSLVHNMILHPIAGIFYAIGCDDVGDAIHLFVLPD